MVAEASEIRIIRYNFDTKLVTTCSRL